MRSSGFGEKPRRHSHDGAPESSTQTVVSGSQPCVPSRHTSRVGMRVGDVVGIGDASVGLTDGAYVASHFPDTPIT